MSSKQAFIASQCYWTQTNEFATLLVSTEHTHQVSGAEIFVISVCHKLSSHRIRKKGPRKKRPRKNRPRLEKRSTEITSTRKKRPQGNKVHLQRVGKKVHESKK